MKSFFLNLIFILTLVNGLLIEDHNGKERSEPIRVACVGDSITEGFKTENSSYPMFLSGMLNSEDQAFIVKNFGSSGSPI